MTTLAKDTPRVFVQARTDLDEHPVIASDIIYQGAAVGDNGSGYARPLQAGDPFRGIALKRADNSDGSAGDERVEVLTKGQVKLSISGLAIDDVGKDVYASDDDTFTLTQGSNTRIGYVARFVSSGVGMVELQVNCGVEAELTDNSGGSADDTIAAISGSGADAGINANFADLTAKVNYLLRRMGQ